MGCRKMQQPNTAVCKLLSLGSTNGASTLASTAIKALISIDNVLAVLFRDSANGASAFASAAAQALININYVSHLCNLRILYFTSPI
jgi:hypothetical protein